MTSAESWQESVLRAVEDESGVESTFPRCNRPDYGLVEVEFDGSVNTLQVLSGVDDAVVEHTRIVVRPARETVQFRFESRGVSDRLEGVSLIKKILKEDIPVRCGFVPEFEVYDDFIIVKSPTWEPVELFDSMRTRLWNLTGLYENDGVYHQRFCQLGDWSETDNVIEKYGSFRLWNILWDIRLQCPECRAEEVKYSLRGDEWVWTCEECPAAWESVELDEIVNRADPLWERGRIVETFAAIGWDEVHPD